MRDPYWNVVSGSGPLVWRQSVAMNPDSIQFDLDIQPQTWTPTALQNLLVIQGQIWFRIMPGGQLELYRYDTGGTPRALFWYANSTQFGRSQIRITSTGTGLGPYDTTLYRRAPGASEWTLVITRTLTVPSALKPVSARAYPYGDSASVTGRLYSAEFFGSVGGASVARLDPSLYATGPTVPDAVDGQPWTVSPNLAPVPGWSTGMPWPGTPGGAFSPHWGGDIRLYVWVALSSGSTFTWGQSDTDNFDAGNVWGGGAPVGPVAPAGRLWVDISCDVKDLETHLGGNRSDGALSRAGASTCSLTLADPDRAYDPLNPNSPWQYAGRSRLAPGTPVWVWAELVERYAVTTWRMFTGTVDTWQEDWALRKADREAHVVASDAVRTLVNLDWGEQDPQGTGETVAERIERILTHYGYTGTRNLDSSGITLQATTLAQSAWELLGRATDDELGAIWIDRLGVLQFRNRDTWRALTAPVLAVGCPDGYDAVLEAEVKASGETRNAVYASNKDGTTQVARSEPSISLYGPHNYKRTDLGMQTDSQAGAWATFLVQVSGYPRAHIESVTLRPAFTPEIWPALLGLRLIQDRVKVQWQPPGEALVEATGRVLGIEHSITRNRWETDLSLTMADLFARVFHWGTHPNDGLTQGNVWV
jgi:hypothetical protein